MRHVLESMPTIVSLQCCTASASFVIPELPVLAAEMPEDAEEPRHHSLDAGVLVRRDGTATQM